MEISAAYSSSVVKPYPEARASDSLRVKSRPRHGWLLALPVSRVTTEMFHARIAGAIGRSGHRCLTGRHGPGWFAGSVVEEAPQAVGHDHDGPLGITRGIHLGPEHVARRADAGGRPSDRLTFVIYSPRVLPVAAPLF